MWQRVKTLTGFQWTVGAFKVVVDKISNGKEVVTGFLALGKENN